MQLSIHKRDITEVGKLMEVAIGGDTIVGVWVQRDGDALYYALYDYADLDGVATVEGHLPEYFEEVK